MARVKTIPPRSKVKPSDQWNLKKLYSGDQAWEKAYKQWERMIPRFSTFRGKLGSSPKALLSCLEFDLSFDRMGERLGTYAFLKSAEDKTNSHYQAMMSRFQGTARQAAELGSYIQPELMAIPTKKMNQLLSAKALEPYRLMLERMRRYKKHTLSPKEERLLAMQGQMSDTANRVFSQLNDSDLAFGIVKNEDGQGVELSHGSFSTLLHSTSRKVRKTAFTQYYSHYKAHENTLAATLNGSIQRDVYQAKVRNFQSAREAALFSDNVPVSVYDNLISVVHDHLPSLYRYYDVRRRAMGLRDIHQYDTYLPIISSQKMRTNFDQAIGLIGKSLAPLGKEYVRVLDKGLRGNWCDRYENKGKSSGAFSCGSYDGDPYILMNFQPTVLDHVFTLSHEAGHSMHSYYSGKHQPYQYYNYTIFVAEVASTFNEQLLSGYLLSQAKTDEERAYLINKEIDDIRGTILRQTMFAEFEKITHELAEENEPLTVDRFQEEYWKLLQTYFGPDFVLDEELRLECFRIPHFYRAFYVYKYATGMSAAIALSQRVLDGGRKQLKSYLNFLSSGCAKFPLDLLRDAGVDMEKPEPVAAAMAHFGRRVDELDDLLSRLKKKNKSGNPRNRRPKDQV